MIIPNKLLKYSLLLTIILSSTIFSQAQRANYQILGISVAGNKSADATTIIVNTGLKVGDEIEVPGDQTISAIKRLWALNIFSDVQIIIERTIDDGVFLLIQVEEHPRIEDVVFKGNDEFDESDLRKEASFVRGQILKPQEVFTTKRKIKELYYDEGYLNTIVTPLTYEFSRADTTDDEIIITWRQSDDFSKEMETIYDYNSSRPSRVTNKAKDRQLLVYEIEEGDEVSIRSIIFNGNESFEDGDLASEFEETSYYRWWKFWSSSNFNKEDFEEDKKLLTTFYRKEGFRDFEILKDSIAYTTDPSEIDLVIDVREGPKYKVRNIDWQGNTIYADQELSERLDFIKGDVFNYEKFNQNLRFNERQDDVSSLYQDFGYLAFRIDAKEEKVAEDSLDIHITLNEGNRFRIGKIDITGNDKTKDKVVRRELFTIPGDYFSRNNIFRSVQQLANLRYFNVEKLYDTGVDYRPEDDSTVSVIYNVEEQSSDFFNASVGYSGSYGMSGAIGLTLTNFSITEPFQLGAGQTLNFQWQFGVGSLYRTFSLGFTEPWFLDTPTMVGFDIYDTRQNYVYDLSQFGLSIKAGRKLTWPDNYFYLSGFFRFQYNNIIDGGGYYTEALTRQYSLGITLSRTDIDNPVFPSRGSKFSVGAQISGGPILPGDVDYYEFNFMTEWYKRLFNSNRFAFFTSVEMGYMEELTAETIIQPFEFYYMGGNGLIVATTPLRGYDDRTVGPRNSGGEIIGGRVKTKFTAELRAALALDPMPIYVLAFAEAGNVFYDLKSADLFNLRRSVGVGLRLLVNPVGLLGFDLGYGFDRMDVDGQDPQWQFHFQFGQQF